jgi:hypothetical protein
MVWLNLVSAIPVGRRGIYSSFKLFLPVFATRRGRGEWVGGVGALWSKVKKAPDPGSGSLTKNLNIFNTKNWYLALGKRIRDVYSGSRIPGRNFSIRIPDPGVKKVMYPGSVTLVVDPNRLKCGSGSRELNQRGSRSGSWSDFAVPKI